MNLNLNRTEIEQVDDRMSAQKTENSKAIIVASLFTAIISASITKCC